MPGRGKIRPSGVRHIPYDTPVDDTIGPRQFDPYRTDIRNCHCILCRDTSYVTHDLALSRTRARALLAALRAGTHVRVEWADYVAQAKREHAARMAEACTSGASDFRIFEMNRGYSGGNNARIFYHDTYSEEFECGLGVGMTPGRYERASAARTERHARQDAERAAQVPALIAADPRNACTVFRVTRALCLHHDMPIVETVDPVDVFVSPWALIDA